MLVFLGEFDFDVDHPDLGQISKGSYSLEYYWLDKWFNVFRFYEPDGRFRNFYCNVNMPPEFDGSVLDYVDLDLDLFVGSDMMAKVLDRDEFEKNSLVYGYGEEIVENALAALEELMLRNKARDFPFDLAGRSLPN